MINDKLNLITCSVFYAGCPCQSEFELLQIIPFMNSHYPRALFWKFGSVVSPKIEQSHNKKVGFTFSPRFTVLLTHLHPVLPMEQLEVIR